MTNDQDTSRLDAPRPWLRQAMQEGTAPGPSGARSPVPLAPSPESRLQARYDDAARRAEKQAKKAKKAKKAKRRQEDWRHPPDP